MLTRKYSVPEYYCPISVNHRIVPGGMDPDPDVRPSEYEYYSAATTTDQELSLETAVF